MHCVLPLTRLSESTYYVTSNILVQSSYDCNLFQINLKGKKFLPSSTTLISERLKKTTKKTDPQAILETTAPNPNFSLFL